MVALLVILELSLLQLMFDAFIVHTQNSKVEAVKDFALNDSNVYVCCHGVFEPHNVMIKTKKYIKILIRLEKKAVIFH